MENSVFALELVLHHISKCSFVIIRLQFIAKETNGVIIYGPNIRFGADASLRFSTEYILTKHSLDYLDTVSVYAFLSSVNNFQFLTQSLCLFFHVFTLQILLAKLGLSNPWIILLNPRIL